MAPLQAAALWTALLILLLVVLSVRVMRARWKHRVSLGDGAGGEMTALSRGFGNAAEYTPLMIGALILLAQLGGSSLEIHLLGGLFFVGRILHPIGVTMRAPNWARAAGMTLTWLPLIAAAVLLLLAAFATI